MLYLRRVLPEHSPSSDFGENQLSRGLISLSLLLSSHLRIFQHSRVRSSTACYCSFNLLKSRSPPLRVYCPRLGRAVNTRFPFASTAKRFRLATDNNSQTHYAKGKQSPRPFDLQSNDANSKLQVSSHTSEEEMGHWTLGIEFPTSIWRSQMDVAPTHCRHMVSGSISLP